MQLRACLCLRERADEAAAVVLVLATMRFCGGGREGGLGSRRRGVEGDGSYEDEELLTFGAGCGLDAVGFDTGAINVSIPQEVDATDNCTYKSETRGKRKDKNIQQQVFAGGHPPNY